MEEEIKNPHNGGSRIFFFSFLPGRINRKKNPTMEGQEGGSFFFFFLFREEEIEKNPHNGGEEGSRRGID